MAKKPPSLLAYHYRGHFRRPSPQPVRSFRLAVLVEGREVWHGDLTEEIRDWARGCALEVTHLWDCPDAVRRHLQSGDPQTQDMARRMASAAMSPTRHAGPPREAARSAWYACQTTASDADGAAQCARDAVESLHRHTTEARQTADLRLRILRRCLPEHRWSLIDGGNDGLRDALSEGRLRVRWGDAPPQGTPSPPQGTIVTILVGSTAIWSGSVDAEVKAWEAWRAELDPDDPGLRTTIAPPMRGVHASGWTDRRHATAENNQLRRLLLQRVLPQPLWGLIGGDEGVLCDALLER